VNVAEVSLHFDNAEGLLPVPFREVVITRRLSRSGDSEYFLNRAPCRLRDVQDLVRGTGLGADSGVVIESRMIDALLSDRPTTAASCSRRPRAWGSTATGGGAPSGGSRRRAPTSPASTTWSTR
jgi:hypothetical protein